MKFYHKYKKELEAAGYRVDEHGYVWDSRGNQSAGEDNYGNVQSKDPNVTDICRAAEAAPKPKAKAKPKMKRARTTKGQYVADDPATPDVNEAWVEDK